MTYQIDQSIKIENTNKTSYVCLANGKIIIISISSKEKRELKLYFRKLEKPLIFKLFTFSVLCAKIIIKTKVGSVAIDTEYSGHERQIKSFILQIFRMEDFKEPIISFTQVGKKSPAHLGAYKALGTKIADIKLTASEILKYYEKTNKS
ncbi:MAG: hypothetical protein C4584_00145 [Armatimonadetes bacterium]|nr:MAG: hypothetical protein C4584_00145 [Armatimonadota bacterium]